MAQLQKIFVYGLGQIPSVFQELLHSQDFYSHHRLTLNFEPVTFSRGRSHHSSAYLERSSPHLTNQHMAGA